MPTFRADRDLVRLEAEDPSIRILAGGLWVETSGGEEYRPAFRVDLGTAEETVLVDPEEALRWEVSEDETRLTAPGLSLSIRAMERLASGTAARSLIATRPDLVTRLLLEAPVTAMKMVGQQLLHAGAVVGPRGAVVVRGAAGAGKSTLVAACHASGLGVLGDESLLVDRDDPDRLEATLRELVLTPASARLLGLEATSVPAFSGGERKRRIPLPGTPAPEQRLARRAATVILGPREPGPARLVPVSGPGFLEAFAAGEIPQERMYEGSPETIARAWDGIETYLLLGAADLPGAVARVCDLVHGSARP